MGLHDSCSFRGGTICIVTRTVSFAVRSPSRTDYVSLRGCEDGGIAVVAGSLIMLVVNRLQGKSFSLTGSNCSCGPDFDAEVQWQTKFASQGSVLFSDTLCGDN